MASNGEVPWVRPDNVPYPNVWLTFEAKESKKSDKIVKYIIQDMPEDRFEDAMKHMMEYFIIDHPMTPITDGVVDKEFAADFQRVWREVLKQKCSVICLREDSDEIVGLNLHYIYAKNDTFPREINKLCTSRGYTNLNIKTEAILYANLCPFEKYNTNHIIGSYGISVQPKYRGYGIAQRILESRKPLGEAFGIKLTHCRFTNAKASRIAEKIGFKVDVEYTIDELNEIDPSMAYENVKTKKIAIKTWVF